ncbi:MAG TPA: ATP-binding cassette domain-containing protein [Candidatus Acidoferrales bacterium]
MGQLSVFADWFRLGWAWPASRTRAEADAPNGAGHALEIRVAHRYGVAGKTTFSLETNFMVQPGVTILRGHSGAGKTTLLRCIAGLAPMENGTIAVGPQVMFDSARGVNLEPRHRKVAFVFQHLALFPHLSVRENVGYGLKKLDASERGERVNAVMASFRIGHLGDRLPSEISGGEQQRVALARALVTEPSVLLLDEPLSSLDVKTKALIVDDLRAWNAAHRIPIVYVTHDDREVRALGERAITLEHGRIVADDSLLGISADTHTGCPDSGNFVDKKFDATVTAVQATEKSVTCRLHLSEPELSAYWRHGALGTKVQIGLRVTE